MWFIGNWKMNGNQHLVEEFLQVDWSQLHYISICPPYPYLADFKENNTILLGAQNCHDHASGAYTGEVSAAMLKEFGVKIVILGHSERRQYCNESSQIVHRKAKQVLAHDMIPVICVGEPESVREAGGAKEYVLGQLKESLPKKGEVIIAYEPIWAIGTGRVALMEEIRDMHTAIKNEVAVTPVLYGGSVNSENAREILELDEVDGVLVGGASLKVSSFMDIINS